MKTVVALTAAALLLPQTDDASSEPVRFEGTLMEGMQELEELSTGAKFEAALEISDSLLAPTDFTRWRLELESQESKWKLRALETVDPFFEVLGLNGYSEPLRAEIRYARGVVQLAAGERLEAEVEFERARAMSGPGELRQLSAYNRGTALLLEGETWRAKIPEIAAQSGAGSAPPPPPMAQGAQAPDEEEPDPLELARASYERAKEALIERLRQGWRDSDTRANTELVQRRLKELDEIEGRREEQEQEQQQDEDESGDEKSEDQPGDEQQDSEPSEPSEDSEGEPDEPDDSEDQQPSESEGEEPEPEEPEEEPEEGEGEGDSQQGEPEKPERESQETYLTREEVQRLLDKLERHEEEADAMRARLYRQSRRRVSQDW